MARKYTISEMKKANTGIGHFFFQRGNRRWFGPHKAVYDRKNMVNYIVVRQEEPPGSGIKFIWYKFNATTGHIDPSVPPVAFRERAEKAMKKSRRW